MKVAEYNITIHQGMVFAQAFAPEYYDTATNTLKRTDYTGYTATFTLWPAPLTSDSLHDQTPILVLTNDSGAIMLGLFESERFGEYGILLYLTQAHTSNLTPWGKGRYNLDIIDPMGHPQLRFQGDADFEEGQKHG